MTMAHGTPFMHNDTSLQAKVLWLTRVSDMLRCCDADNRIGGREMRILIWIGLSIAVVATASAQSKTGAPAPARSATLPADIQPVSLNRLPVVKREQMD